MSYTRHNFPTKKALKDATLSLKVADPRGPIAASLRERLGLIRTSAAHDEPRNGETVIEGPRPVHRWYATVRTQDWIVVEVIS